VKDAPAIRKPSVPVWRRYGAACLVLAGAGLLAALAVSPPEASADALPVRKVAEYPHDHGAFSQGLVIHNSRLIEGTGRYRESSLREVDINTGNILRQVALPDDVFGEGVTVWDNQIVQLTWENGYLITWDLATMQQESRVAYNQIDRSLKQGWGITHDGNQLIISDGSAVLRFVDPQTWRTVRRVKVRSGIQSVRNLNELEYVNGEILANVWYSTRIARINPETGMVNGWLELNQLFPAAVRRNRDAVLNGIAWDPDARRLYVTGKLWPALYEITFDGLPKPRPSL
jgi:glutamine cyclotransferase